MKKVKTHIIALAFLVITSACSRAETLAGLKPTPVDISAPVPTWQNGVAQLVKERCASCHSEKKSEFVPVSTPLLDFNIEAEFRSVRQRSLARIQDNENPMPPTYADPLSADERKFLEKYLTE
ncbi:MAG: hypothetical protein RI953_1670 [Pseudomonadota bacterium]|jgi:uncharacterized membrane protein